MIKKILSTIFTLIMLATLIFSSFTLYYMYMPQDPISMFSDEIIPDEVAMINYGMTPVFAKNLRFNHNNISYFITLDCSEERKQSMIDAFEAFESEMDHITFYKGDINADITIGCGDTTISFGDNLFAAGEGGPSRIINTSSFKTIEKGKISLYDDQRCNYPIVELHELLHVFGFDHSKNPTSIMYNISKCNQRITPDMITIIDELYSIEPLADAIIGNLTAIKRGMYLDFNITILNEGLQNIDEIKLTVIADDEIIQIVNMEKLEIGYGRSLEAKNVKLPGIKTQNITFEVDYEQNVREINEDNNIRVMSTGF